MKKIIQRMSSLFLVICLVVSLLQSFVNAEDLQEEVVEETPVSEGAYGEHYYEVIDKSMTWTSAKEYCENLGGHLVTITSAEEQAFIEKLLPEVYTKRQYWLGATSESGEWVWVTGEEFVYTNWDKNQPDHNSCINGKYEEYAQIHNYESGSTSYPSTRYKWNDICVDNDVGNTTLVGPDYIGIICEYETYDSEKTSNSSVCYFKEWDAENQIAYFGQNDLLGSQVTEETDTSFLENIDELVGEYVLVETKSREDDLVAPDTLISIKSVETKIGTVSSADANEIVIDGVSYATPKDANLYGINENDLILYHLYENELVGIEALQTEKGTLTYWNKDTKELTIDPEGVDESATTYTLSSLADEETVAFLGETGQRSSSIQYMEDSVKFVYEIKLVQDDEDVEENNGFSPENDGWCFRNNYDGFDYDMPYKIPEERYAKVYGDSYVASAKASSEEVFTSMIQDEWGGNCYGMSVTAVMFYLNMLDWNYYSIDEFETVNSYYTELIRENLLVNPTLHAVSKQGSGITNLIESYQILQCGSNYGYKDVDSTIQFIDSEYRVPCSESDNDEFNEYESYYIHNSGGTYIRTVLNKIVESEIPLIIDIVGNQGAHALVTRTDKKPEEMSDGSWRVYVYDPNHPYLSEEISNKYDGEPEEYYSNGSDLYIELYPGINQWRYVGSVNGSSSDEYWGSNESWEILNCEKENGKTYTPEYFYVYSIQDVDYPVQFEGTEEWLSRYQNMTGFVPDGYVDIYTEDGVLICSVEDGKPVFCNNEVEYNPYIGFVENEEYSLTGRLTIPYSEFVIEYKNADDISIIGNENVINVASSGSATLHVSMNDGEIQITSNEDNEIVTQITNVYSSSEYTSIVAEGDLNKNDIVVLKLDEDKFDGKIDGDGKLNVYTDNEENTESQQFMILDETDGDVVIDDVRGELPEEHIHSYLEPVFEWDDEFISCMALFECIDGDDTQIIDCTITSETTPATETESGETVYTASVEFNGETYTDTKTVEIPPTGPTEPDIECTEHKWNEGKIITEATCTENGEIEYMCTVCEEIKTEVIEASGHVYTNPSFNWSEDYSTCIAVFVCINEDDTQNVECNVTSVTTDATCTEDGKIVYTASVEFSDETYTDSVECTIDATGHNYVDGVCSCGEKDPEYVEPEEPSVPAEPVKPSKFNFLEWLKDLFGENDDADEPDEPVEPENPDTEGPEQPSEPDTPVEPDDSTENNRPEFNLWEILFGWWK